MRIDAKISICLVVVDDVAHVDSLVDSEVSLRSIFYRFHLRDSFFESLGIDELIVELRNELKETESSKK